MTLRDLYIHELDKNGFPSPLYRSEKLKAKIVSHTINKRISFTKIKPGDKGFISYYLIYSASIPVSEVVSLAYKLGAKDRIEEVALILRSKIQQVFSNSKPLLWPPTPDDLDYDSSDELLPCDLVKFLNLLLTGEKDRGNCEKSRRVVSSIGQVIIFYLKIMIVIQPFFKLCSDYIIIQCSLLMLTITNTL